MSKKLWHGTDTMLTALTVHHNGMPDALNGALTFSITPSTVTGNSAVFVATVAQAQEIARRILMEILPGQQVMEMLGNTEIVKTVVEALGYRGPAQIAHIESEKNDWRRRALAAEASLANARETAEHRIGVKLISILNDIRVHDPETFTGTASADDDY